MSPHAYATTTTHIQYSTSFHLILCYYIPILLQSAATYAYVNSLNRHTPFHTVSHLLPFHLITCPLLIPVTHAHVIHSTHTYLTLHIIPPSLSSCSHLSTKTCLQNSSRSLSSYSIKVAKGEEARLVPFVPFF